MGLALVCFLKMLHITNGESVVHGLRAGAIAGTYLSWLDVLHDGPVPLKATLAEVSEIRAATLASFGWAGVEEVREQFRIRDEMIRSFRDFDEVVLWFEHDLFDQLQLIQILDFFSKEDLSGFPVSLIQIDKHPEVVPFHGLGMLTGKQLAELLPRREAVTAEQLALGSEAWDAFRSPDPRRLLEVIGRDLRGLPFLRAALIRRMEEFPSTRDGLARTQRQLLEAAAGGARTKRDLYMRSQRAERSPWGDASIFLRLDGLGLALKVIGDDAYELTDFGRQLLEGSADWLSGTDAAWRWDPVARTLVEPACTPLRPVS